MKATGGRELELIDPHSDNMLGMNWAGSDETQKTTNLWTLVEHTGVLDHGRNAADELQILLESGGECLIDSIEVFNTSGVNRVSNGDFESDLSGWIIQGNHKETTLETTEGYTGSQSMHLRAQRKGDHSVNRVETDFTSAFAQGETATIRARVRWLCGHPGVLFRMHGNWLEAVGDLTVPYNLGTPGAQNSCYAANTGPAIDDVNHAPVLPAAAEDIVVTARVYDPDGLASVTLRYRNDTAAPAVTNSVAMTDDGTGGDARAGDGIYSATIPGQALNQTVAYHVEATDSHASPASNSFPESVPLHECLVMFGQVDPNGSFPTYRFWVTEANRIEWATRQKLSDTLIPGTLVYGNHRVIHEAGGRYRGSPFIRKSGNPETLNTSFVLYSNKDEVLIGSRSFNLDRLEGDDCYQRERVSLWLADQIDIPFFNQRHVHVYFNEHRKGVVYGDSHQPNDDFVGAWWPEGDGGSLHKIDDWFEFNDAAQVSKEFNVNGQLVLYTTTGGAKKKARYRWSWRKENVGGLDDDYSDFFELIDVMNLDHTSDEYAAQVPLIVDYEEWMRVLAIEHIIRNWDSFGSRRGKNMSIYKPRNDRWKMLMWDLDHSHLTGNPNENKLFDINCPTMKNKFFKHPPFLRAYWQGIYDTAIGPMTAALCDPVMDAYYEAMQLNGVTVVDPDVALKQWIADRRAFLLGQVNSVDASLEITTNSGNDYDTTDSIITLTGTAPVAAHTIKINDEPYVMTYSSVTEWSCQVGLNLGANTLVVKGYDLDGDLVATDSITVTLTDPTISPVGWLVINEIMYHPTNSAAEFVEIHNQSDTVPFDLSGWRINGVDFTFPAGSIILPTNFVVVAENSSVYASFYGNPEVLVGEFDGNLDNGGETLRLQMPSGGGDWITIDRVRYDDKIPWPVGADGITGHSLQLIDPAVDNNRVGNWVTGGAVLHTPGEENSVRRNLPYMPDLCINEIQPNNINSAADNMGDYDPWVELYNAGGVNVLAVQVHQAAAGHGDLAMDLSLDFASTNVVASNAAWRVLQDGSDPGSDWMETSFDDAVWSNGTAVLGFGNGGESTLVPTGHVAYYFRHEFPTPVTPEDPVLSLRADDGAVVYLNGVEVFRTNMPLGAVSNTTPATVAVEGGAEAFVATVDLSPAGFYSASVMTSLDDCYLTDDFSNLTNWSFPGSVSLDREEFMLVWADGEPGEQVGNHLHTSFSMNSSSGCVALVWLYDSVPIVLDYVAYEDVSAGRTFGMYPDGNDSDPRQVFFFPTPGTTNDHGSPIPVRINEWMAINNLTIRDMADWSYEDWIELHNSSTSDVDLAGYTLTDDVDTPARWIFPANTTIAAGGFLMVWTDDDAEQTGGGSYHTNFKLSGSGEEVALYTPEGVLVDWITFGPQVGDVSEGRFRDSEAGIYTMTVPTPNAPNVLPVVIVTSDHGSPSPTNGTNVVSLGAVVDCSVGGSPIISGSTTQYVCTGWSGSGDVPASGSATSVTVTVTGVSSIAWSWQTNYWFEATNGVGGTIDQTNRWAEAGSNITVTATPAANYYFVEWTGNPPAGQATVNPLVLSSIDAARSVTATFATVTSQIATNIGLGTATFRGAVIGDNGAAASFSWGTGDEGQDAGAWDDEIDVSVAGDGTISTVVTGLLYGVRYYYRARATNVNGSAWSTDLRSVVTPAPASVGIANAPVTEMGPVTGTLNAVLNASGSVYSVWVHWGTINMGAGPGWDHSYFVGSYTNVGTTNLSHGVGGLPSETDIYYTFHATNSVVDIYATPSASFMTLTPDATMFSFR